MEVDLVNRSREFVYYKVILRWDETCNVACEIVKGKRMVVRAEGKCEWAEGKALKTLMDWEQVKTVRPI